MNEGKISIASGWKTLDSNGQKATPSWWEAQERNSEPIYQTERGRQEAQAIEQKAEAIIERRQTSLDQNRNAWVAREANQIQSKGGLTQEDGPKPPIGSQSQTAFQQAEQKFALQREKVAKRVNDQKKVMLNREPAQNRIRGFVAKDRVQSKERDIEQEL